MLSTATLFPEYPSRELELPARRRGNPYRLELPAALSFSGGRTSGKLLWEVVQAFGGTLPVEVVVLFANTGREDKRTLEFVQACSQRWGVSIRWLEYWRDPALPLVTWKGKQALIGCHSFREVDFETAARAGEPFEALIAVKAAFRQEVKDAPPVLPNPVQRFCSGELKQRTFERFVTTAYGWDAYTVAVGLRADEPRRVAKLRAQSNEARDYVCPLYDAGVAEAAVLAFWQAQPFDLELRHDPLLGTYEGNCDLCFLKRAAKIKRLAQERPDALEWWAGCEQATGQRFRNDRFSYTDLATKRVALNVLPQEAAWEEEATCLCTD